MRMNLPSWADISKWKLKTWGWSFPWPSFLLWQSFESSRNCRDDSDFQNRTLNLDPKSAEPPRVAIHTWTVQLHKLQPSLKPTEVWFWLAALNVLRCIRYWYDVHTFWGRGACGFHQFSCLLNSLALVWALLWEIDDELPAHPIGAS